MKFIYIIIIILMNMSFGIGLKALVIPNNATMISVSGTGVSDYIDININPASIHQLKPHSSFSNNQWFGDLSGSKISYLWIEKNTKNFVSFESLGLDDIELRNNVPSDEPIGLTEAKWMAIDFASSFPMNKFLLDSNFDLGYKIKFNYSKLHTERYYGYTFDIGGIKHSENINLGFSIKNIGREYKGSTYEMINPRYTIGVSKVIPLINNDQEFKSKLFLYADMVYDDNELIYKVASKANFSFLNIMLGTSYSDGYQDLSYGLSFIFNDWEIVYGSLNHENPILGSPICFEIKKTF